MEFVKNLKKLKGECFMDHEKKEFGKWWVWVLFLLMITGVIFTGLNYVGLIGRTVVERKVFENSFQYSEARKTEIATFEAQLAQIERKLSNPNLDNNTRTNLQATADSIKIKLNVARRK